MGRMSIRQRSGKAPALHGLIGVALILVLSCLLAAVPSELQMAWAFDGLAGAQSDVAASGTEGIGPGVYTVPVALKKANDHDQPSGAAAAMASEARLSVGSDGAATLTVETKPVTVGCQRWFDAARLGLAERNGA